MSLRLDWRALDRIEDSNGYSYSTRTPAWLNGEKLAELGFDIDAFIRTVDQPTFSKKFFPREVFIVLEYDGKAYEEAVKRAEAVFHEKESSFNLNPADENLRESYESAKQRLNRERRGASRLFAIDAGLDPHRLRDRYADCSSFIIAKGLIKPGYGYAKDKGNVSGYITKLSVATIHVPLKHRGIFDSVLARDKVNRNDIRSPRYQVKLAYGSRFEPWIISVSSLDEKSD